MSTLQLDFSKFYPGSLSGDSSVIILKMSLGILLAGQRYRQPKIKFRMLYVPILSTQPSLGVLGRLSIESDISKPKG